MFKIQSEASVKWPVTINIPRDGGDVTKAKCTVHFELIPSDEFNAIYDNGGNDEDLLHRVVKGWGSDVADEDGNPLVFNEENLDKLLRISYARVGFVQGYMECSSGKAAARKN